MSRRRWNVSIRLEALCTIMTARRLGCLLVSSVRRLEGGVLEGGVVVAAARNLVETTKLDPSRIGVLVRYILNPCNFQTVQEGLTGH